MTDSRNTDAALKPLLQMCKDCDPSNVSTIRTLILKAMTSPDIFSGFDQIKAAVALSSAPDGEALSRALDLFSHGMYKDYVDGGFMNLTDAQIQKLKLLTVVTLVERACIESSGILPYSTIADALLLPKDSLDSLREVEEIVIACIYTGIVHGKLCQQRKSLVVSSERGAPCRPRDVPNVSNLLFSLKSLKQNLEDTMTTLEGNRKDAQNHREQYAAPLKRSKDSSKPKARAASSRGGRSREIRTRRQGKRSRGPMDPFDPFPRV
jgi:COP9 signalosome complex subunit 7